MVYDPQKAHDYYERTKKLKGRDRAKNDSSTKGSPNPPKLNDQTKTAIARVSRLKSAVAKLETALSEARAALSEKRQTARKTEKKNSDGKSTAAEKQASKKYRDKHQTEIASKQKKDSSGGGSSSSSTSNVSDMSVQDLEARIIKIKSALADAKRQLSNASQQLGQLAHSALTSEPTFNEHFARLRSAERRPSV